MSAGKPPSRWYYLIAVLVPIVGCAVTFATGFGGLQKKVEAMDRFVMPGQVSLDLKQGTYTGYYEQQSVVDGKVYSGGALSGLRCVLRSESGEEVPIQNSSMSSSYTLGSYAGTSIFELTPANSAQYQLACAYSEGMEG
jgi:hypothetical protein